MGLYVVEGVEPSGYYGKCVWNVYVKEERQAETISHSFYIDNVPPNMKCTGEALKPTVVVRSKRYYGETLVEGEDYTVSHANNVLSGKANIIVKGKGYYKGKLKASFKIAKPAEGVKLTVGVATYEVTKVGKQVAFVGAKTANKVEVPAKVKIGNTTYNVTSIAANAFKGDKKVKDVTIGANVAKVGSNAFKGASKCVFVTLATAKLDEGSVKNILSSSNVKALKLTGKAKAMKKAYKGYAGTKVKVK